MDDKYTKITTNGEICYDKDLREYVVFDETYSDTICTTAYKDIAYYALSWYADNVLKQ